MATDEKFGALVISKSGYSIFAAQFKRTMYLCVEEINSSGSMHVINLRYLRDLNILPSTGTNGTHPHVSIPKVQKRLEGSIEARWCQVQSPQAQKLFLKIKKL